MVRLQKPWRHPEAPRTEESELIGVAQSQTGNEVQVPVLEIGAGSVDQEPPGRASLGAGLHHQVHDEARGEPAERGSAKDDEPPNVPLGPRGEPGILPHGHVHEPPVQIGRVSHQHDRESVLGPLPEDRKRPAEGTHLLYLQTGHSLLSAYRHRSAPHAPGNRCGLG